MTLKNNKARLVRNINLCASFHHHMWIQTGVTIRKWLKRVMTSVTLSFDFWSWDFTWTSRLSMVITGVKKVWRTDGQTDRQTEGSVLRAAWSQLRILIMLRRFIKSLDCQRIQPRVSPHTCLIIYRPHSSRFNIHLRFIFRGLKRLIIVFGLYFKLIM